MCDTAIGVLKKSYKFYFIIYSIILGFILEQCDMVLTGAEAVVENGGIINRV